MDLVFVLDHDIITTANMNALNRPRAAIATDTVKKVDIVKENETNLEKEMDDSEGG